MRDLLFAIAVAGCGGGNNASIDAASDTPADAPALDCSTYCAKVQMNCTGANAQYGNMEQCTAACPSFAVGTSMVTDTVGNTLGCRINYAVAASTMASTQCPHAGPAGDLLTASAPGFCSGGDVCMNFCTLDLLACGSKEAPLPGDPTDEHGTKLYQYVNLADCMRLCPLWDKTHAYSTTSTGDSLACRLSAAVAATVSLDIAKVSCNYTADIPTGQCAGAAAP